ncbi:hypothetical protein GCM10008967_40490 [Bacillus carboniphilus]|uniref:YqhP n=1 Tax=Bacillus carboniphilus TaxID=86663 RepID=A0ABP3GHU3_9BACI
MSPWKKWLFYSLIALAILGVMSFLLTDPSQLFRSLLITVLMAALFIFIVTRFRGTGTRNRKEHQAFMKAAKQSKKRMKMREEQSNQKNRSLSKSSFKKAIHTKKKSAASHLTVIEGKKGKKKDKASF